MKSILIFSLVLILLIEIAQASVIATIGMKGLSITNPEAAEAVSQIICLSNPIACAEGKVIEQVYGEAVQELAKSSPEAAEAVMTYNKVKEWTDLGAEIDKELEVDEQGEITKGTIQFSEETEVNIGSFVGKNLEDEDVSVKGIEVSKINGKSVLTFTHKESKVCVKGNFFENIKSQLEAGLPSNIVLDEEGSILRAEFTVDKKGGVYGFGKGKFYAPPESRVYYDKESGQPPLVKIPETSSGQVKIDSLKIGENAGSYGEVIYEGSFSFNEDKIRGIGESVGKITTKDGKITRIWKGTDAIVRGIRHRTHEEHLNLYYEDIFNPSEHVGENYLNYGRSKVWLGGRGYETILEKGNPLLGKDSSEPFFVSIDMKGGQAQINSGGIEIDKSPIDITNGRNFVRYYDENNKINYKMRIEDCLSEEVCNPLGGLSFQDGGLIKYNEKGAAFRIKDSSRKYNPQDKVTFNIEKEDVRTYNLDQGKMYLLAKRGDTGGKIASLNIDSSKEWGHTGVMIYDYDSKEWIISEIVAEGVHNVNDIQQTYFVPLSRGEPKLTGVYEVQTEIDPDKALKFAREGEGKPFSAYPPWVYKIHNFFTEKEKQGYVCSEWTHQVIIHGSPISESIDTSIGVSKGDAPLSVNIVQNVFLKGGGYTIARELVQSKKVKEIYPIETN